VAVKRKDLIPLLAARGRGNQIIKLALAHTDGGGERTVLLKEVQMDPVRGGPLHVDFLEIAMDRKIRVEVPLVLDGLALGKGKGGLVESHLRKLVVECFPSALPDAIRVDVSRLDVGDALHVRDLVVPEGARVLGDGGRAVVSVTIPAAEEEVAPAAVEAAPAEPEVLTKREGKEEAAAPPAEEKGKKEKEPEKKGKEKEPEKAEKAKG
jgi:large subunit ribosomal protein L25